MAKVRPPGTKEEGVGPKKPAGWGGFGGKRHGPRTRKRASRKLKGGHGRLVVFKKTICGLEIRPIYYVATAHGWWEIAPVDSELPFCAKGAYR